MLKYELNELKVSSSKEIHSLKESQLHLQTTLDTERDDSLKTLAACKSELMEFKNLYNKTNHELDVDRTKLKQAVRILIGLLIAELYLCSYVGLISRRSV